MDKETNKKLRKYVLAVAKLNPRFAAAYVFGSYARNLAKAESDIDIAIIIDKLEESEKFDMQVQFLVLSSQFDTRIEPHVLSKQDLISKNPFAVEIMKTGMEIPVPNISTQAKGVTSLKHE